MNSQKVGLGLRRELMQPLQSQSSSSIQFLEVAPENWIGVGGKLYNNFRELLERYPLFCHGLSLSLGGFAELQIDLLKQIKKFLRQHQVQIYSEHLSYCSDEGQLYDLLPIPFTEEAVKHVAQRIRQVQEILERPIAIENVSYYLTPPISEMSESEFLSAVLTEADCELLLDVNNVYVNSINHRYDPSAFIRAIPAERIRYLHVAGHYDQTQKLKIDTHGAAVIDPVWRLLEETYRTCGIFPTLLERDFNFPPFEELLEEVQTIHTLQQRSVHPQTHEKPTHAPENRISPSL